MFFIGDLTRFLSLGYYVKPAFILGVMVLCGAGTPLVVAGLRRIDPATFLLLAGVPFYYILIPTASEQTYYALPVVPVLALLAARGAVWLETALPIRRHATLCAVIAMWLGGFAIAAPYTIRHDRVSFEAARAVAAVSQRDDLILVANMHDRGVGIGGFNSTIMTLSGRLGWSVPSTTPSIETLQEQAGVRRTQGAKWFVITWFTPAIEPWVNRFLPASFSRVPRINGVAVDGEELAVALGGRYPVATRGENFAVLALD